VLIRVTIEIIITSRGIATLGAKGGITITLFTLVLIVG